VMLALAAMTQRPAPVYACGGGDGSAYDALVAANNPLLPYDLTNTYNAGSTGNGANYQLTAVAAPTAGGAASLIANGDGATALDGTQGFYLTGDGNGGAVNCGFTTRTVELWFSPASLPVNQEQMLYEEGGGTNGLNVYLYNDQVYAGVWVGTNRAYISTPNFVEVGKIYYVTFVYNAGAMELYVNIPNNAGNNPAPIATGTGPAAMINHADQNGIGLVRQDTYTHVGQINNANGVNTNFFDGTMDNVAVYASAFTAQQATEKFGMTDGVTVTPNCHPTAVSLSGFTAVSSVMMPIVLAMFALLTIATAVAVRHHRS
ncbi:MAG: LamG domain-containing protein, partial [Anaerolineales bacterium]|nr:LamG domain-containing protein [Anaerolineales bacterium]